MACLRRNVNDCVHKTLHFFAVADLQSNRSQEAIARSYFDETTT